MHTLRFTLCLLMTLLPAFPAMAETGAPEAAYRLRGAELFQVGVDRWFSGDRRGAIQAWEEALVLDPHLDEAHYNIAVALRDQRILDRRENCLSREEVLECLSSVQHLSAGPTTELKKALRSLNEATRLNPDHEKAVYMKGVIEGQLERYDQAEESLSRHLEQQPNNATGHYLLCVARKARGNLERAVSSCRQAIEKRPEYAEAHHLLGTLFLELQRSDDAAEAFQKVVDLRPRSASAWFNLGMARAGREDFRGAVDAYLRAVDIGPESGAVHLNLGVALDALGKGSSAIDHTRSARNLFSDAGEWRLTARAGKNLDRFMKKYWGLPHNDRFF